MSTRGIVVVAAMIVLASGAGVFAWRFFHPSWEPWVVDQLSHPPRNDWPRPSSAAVPVQGHFGERLEPAWPRLKTLQEEWNANDHDANLRCLQQTIDGEELGDTCKRWLLKAEPVLPAIEQALASTSAGALPRLAPLRCTEQEDYLLATAGLAFTMETSWLLDEGKTREATDACLQSLELARDDQWWGFAGVVASHSTAVMAAWSCAAIVRSAEPEDRARLVAGIRRIRQGLPDAPQIIEQTRLFVLANEWAPYLSKWERRQLPHDVDRCVALVVPGEHPMTRRQRNALAPGLKEFWSVIETAARTPPPDLNHALGSGAVVPAGWENMHLAVFTQWWRSRTLPNLLDALEELARDDEVYRATGAWPRKLLHAEDVHFDADSDDALTVQLDYAEQAWQWSDGGSLKAEAAWRLPPPDADDEDGGTER